ncbi:hypothetical protein F4677DRAFT_256927 [Hypoxylon crocopeplum]|nr:hypothetical protein F4677DRAFT_256927 [Hypoxylon crocopeplum]
MNTMPTDLNMAWIAHTFPHGLMPDEVWTIITWIAFLFKLASLAFAVPLLSLIAFDFCLWIWRLNQPQPQDTSQPNRISRKAREKRANLATSNGTGSATALATDPTASQRRIAYSGHAGD